MITAEFERRNEVNSTENIAAEFTNYYSSRGYFFEDTVGIADKIDSSVVFIGASISVLRKYINTEIPKEGVAILQPCLRSWNKSLFHEDEQDIEYNSFFTMCSTLTPPHTEGEVSRNVICFITDSLGVNKERIGVRVASEHHDLLESILSLGLSEENILIDDRLQDYYQWSYGQEGLTGRGATFAIKDNESGFRDIGNVIIMEDSGFPVGVEWGFGLETLLSRIENMKQPLEASKISEVFAYHPGVQAKFADAIMASLEMYAAGVKPGRSGQSFILKQYLKGVNYLSQELSLSREQLKEIARGYCRIKGYFSEEAIIPEMLVNRLDEYERQAAKSIGQTALRY